MLAAGSAASLFVALGRSAGALSEGIPPVLDLGTLTGYLKMDDSQVESVLQKLPGKMEISGTAMKLAAGAIAVGIGAALSQGLFDAIELDSSSRKVAAQLGLTENESARIGGIAGRLYADAYGESVEDVSSAVASVMSSFDGMRVANDEAIEAMTAKALTFGSIFKVDTARSTQVVGQLIKGGLVKDANEGFDLITAAFQKVPAAVREDILDAADEYGPFFAQMGLDGEAAMSMLVAASEKGMYGIDKTGDAVKEFSIRATDMSATSKAAYDALGLSQEDMTRKLLAGGDQAAGAYDQIVGGLRSVQDPAAQSQAALALFGTPLEDLGTSEIPTFLAGLQETSGALGDVTGKLDEAGKVANGGAGAGWEQLSRTWGQIVGQVGAALLPLLDGLLSWLNDNPAILAAVATAVGILAVAFVALTVAAWAANIALLANPITWIILAIVALIAAVVLLVLNWDAVVKWISDVWAGFIGWITGVIDGFIGWWNGVWEGFASWIGQLWEGLVSVVQGIFWAYANWLYGVVMSIVGWWNGLWSGIGAFFQNLWNGLVAWAVSLIVGFVRNWQSTWAGLSGFFSGLWSGIVGTIQNAWNGALSFLGSIPSTILSIFSGIGSWLYGAGRDLINGLLNGVRSLAGSIGSFFLNLLPGWIVGPFKAALGIHSPSTVFRGLGRNIVEGVLLGTEDKQTALDARMRGLVGPQDYSVGARMAGAMLTAQTAAEGPVRVSLEGATLVMDVDGRAVKAVIREQIADASEERRAEVVNGAGEVVFS